MGSIGELIGLIALWLVTGVPLVVLCICYAAHVADSEIEEYRERRDQR